MALRCFNTVHITVFETRCFPLKATRIVARWGDNVLKLADLKDGKVGEEESSVTILGPFDSTEAIWFHAYDSGVLIDGVLCSCMLLLSSLDLNLRPFEGWLPFFDSEGQIVGRAAIQIIGDHSQKLKVAILRGICDPEDGDKIGGAYEPYVVMKVRDEKFTTDAHSSSTAPIWDCTHEVLIGLREKVLFQVLDRKDPKEVPPSCSEVLGIDLLTRMGQFLWVPVLNSKGGSAGKILLQMKDATMVEKFPLRLLQTQGLAYDCFTSKKEVGLYVQIHLGKQVLKSSVKNNFTEPIWDEEVILDVASYDSLHLLVKISNLLFDDVVGEAFLPVKDMIEHRGKQVWVDLNNTVGVLKGKILIWFCPPPGSVYPDTLADRHLELKVPTPPEDADEPLPPVRPTRADGEVPRPSEGVRPATLQTEYDTLPRFDDDDLEKAMLTRRTSFERREGAWPYDSKPLSPSSLERYPEATPVPKDSMVSNGLSFTVDRRNPSMNTA